MSAAGSNAANNAPDLDELARIGAAVIAHVTDRRRPDPDPLTLTETAAARRLGCSGGFFKSHVLPELRVIRRGSRVLIPVSELERWIDRNAARTVT